MFEDIEKCRRCGKIKTAPRDHSTALCLECEAETSCKHDNHEGGLRKQTWVCAAGVKWFDLVKPQAGCMLRHPCSWREGDEQVTCPKFEPTPIEEGIAKDKSFEEMECRMTLVLPVVAKVKKEHRNQDWRGEVPCPAGCGGVLALTHSAYNGHVWGCCSTVGCLNWME